MGEKRVKNRLSEQNIRTGTAVDPILAHIGSAGNHIAALPAINMIRTVFAARATLRSLVNATAPQSQDHGRDPRGRANPATRRRRGRRKRV